MMDKSKYPIILNLCFVLATADRKSLVRDVERHVEEAQELVSV
jgi:hypothetical protein